MRLDRSSRMFLRLRGAVRLSLIGCAFGMAAASSAAGASEQMGFVRVVKSDPSDPATLFAAAEKGVFRSADAGLTWIATGITEPTAALAIAPATPARPMTVYAGQHTGLYRSEDGGASWRSAGVSDSVCSVEVDPTDPRTLYVSTCSQIIRSMDGGASWGRVGPNDGPFLAVAIAAGPPMMLYAADGSARVFSSTDGGATWSDGGSPDPNVLPMFGLYGFYLVIDPARSTTAYVSYWGWSCDSTACFTTGAITKSTDGGATWFVVNQVLYYGSWVAPQVYVSPVAVDPLAPDIFYAAWSVSCDQYEDYCAVWAIADGDWISKSTEGGVSDLSASSLWFDPLTPTVLYASTSSGIVRSTDGGVTWSGTGSPPPPPPPPPPSTDTAPPDTAMTSAADGTGTALANDAITTSQSVTLSFTGSDNIGVSRFECLLDGESFGACASPRTYVGLALGRHTFEVRAVDTSNNVDATPARYTWTVDAEPETTITGAVDGRGKSVTNGGRTPSDELTVRFAGTDNGTVARFECSLDGRTFGACASPVTYTGIARGSHTFRVRAIDNNAFPDPSPATFTWTR